MIDFYTAGLLIAMLLMVGIYMLNQIKLKTIIRDKDTMIDLLNTEVKDWMKKYNSFFCEVPNCSNVKYYRFKKCTVHVEPNVSEVDSERTKLEFSEKSE